MDITHSNLAGHPGSTGMAHRCLEVPQYNMGMAQRCLDVSKGSMELNLEVYQWSVEMTLNNLEVPQGSMDIFRRFPAWFSSYILAQPGRWYQRLP